MEWWADTDLCCMAAWTCLYCCDTSTSPLDNEEDELVLEIDEAEEEDEAACCKMRCSISCSCWRALTNAAFSRLVCSAFRAFFWLEDMHWSQRMVPVFSFLQREVKSVLHWAQTYGSLGMQLASATAGPKFPVVKKQERSLVRTPFASAAVPWQSEHIYLYHASPVIFAQLPPALTNRWTHYWPLKAGSWTQEQEV